MKNEIRKMANTPSTEIEAWRGFLNIATDMFVKELKKEHESLKLTLG